MVNKNTNFPTISGRKTPVQVNSSVPLSLAQVQAVLPSVSKIQYVNYNSTTNYHVYYIWLPDTVTITTTGFTSGATLQWQLATRSNSSFFDDTSEEILTMDIMRIYNY